MYNLCWFKEAKQENKIGLDQVLGKWSGWGFETKGSSSDSSANKINFKHMIYTDGSLCQTKSRDAAVYLECGWENRIVSVDEPSMCSYVIKFTTPIACVI